MDFELTEEQQMLKEQVARFVDQEVIPLAPVIDEEERFPKENFRAMADMGLFGIALPEEYGGAGSDFLSCVLVMEELMRGCVSTGNTYGAHAILCTESIFRNGNEEQRRRFLPDLIAGKKIGALALTEPGAGSDALSLRCRAEKKGGRLYPERLQDVYHQRTDRRCGHRLCQDQSGGRAERHFRLHCGRGISWIHQGKTHEKDGGPGLADRRIVF